MNGLNAVSNNDLDSVISIDTSRQAPKPFVSQDKLVLVGNPARKLSTQDRARLLKIINDTRTGKAHYTVEVSYDKQTDADPRIAPVDYQAPSGVSTKVHVGLIVNAKLSKHGHFYLTLLDAMRQNQGQQGFTSMRVEGLRKLSILTRTDGPVPPKS